MKRALPTYELVAHNRDAADRFDRFCFTEDRHAGPHRLRVEWEGACTDILVETTTSWKATAEGTGVEERITLTHDEVKWLHATLTDLMARWEKGEPPDAPCPALEPEKFETFELHGEKRFRLKGTP